MTPAEAQQVVVDEVNVTPQMVSYAKAFILSNYHRRTQSLVDSLISSLELTDANAVVIHPSVDTPDIIKNVAKQISWRLACSEGIWSLISNGLLIPGGGDHAVHSYGVQWSTMPPCECW